MCVGLSAKVIRVEDGTAVIDASGAKRAIARITESDRDETRQIMETLS